MRFFNKEVPEGEWKLWFAWYPVWAWKNYDELYARKYSHSFELVTVWLEKVWVKRNDSTSITKYTYKLYDK